MGAVTAEVEITGAPGTPKSAEAAASLARFDARMRLPLVLSALLPIVISPESGGWLATTIGVVSWLVFLVDYVVRTRQLVRYRHTGFGRFDLVVVILTAPWFLLPGFQAGRFVVILRLARLARLVIATGGARRLIERLGRVVIVALGVVVVAASVAFRAEHPVNDLFATRGDAMWWGIVTLTTVGYGDVYPITPTGRWMGVIIMVTGIAVLGVLAGSLASFFKLEPAAVSATSGTSTATPATADHVNADAVDAGTAGPPPVAEEIGRLADLVERGALTAGEFEARKALLLAS
jgi:voltage-gated potassium channel